MLGAVWLGLFVLFQLFESKLLYAPPRALDGSPREYSMLFEETWISTADGLRLCAWWMPGKEGAPVLLEFHGNAENISHGLEMYSAIHGLGWSQLAVDFRGYGKSDGKPSEKGLFLDGEAAYDFLRRRGVAPGNIFLYGRSLGAAVAFHVAASGRPAAGLVTEGAFLNTHEAARDILPWVLPAPLFVENRYDNAETVRRLGAMPKLFIHALHDEVMPVHHSRELFALAAPPKNLAVLPEGGHNDLLFRSREAWLGVVENFVEMNHRRKNAPADDGGK
jgi:hypothetical protein